MGKVRIKANLVISVKDSFTGSSDYIGAILVRTKSGKTALKKSGGNFVFTNLESENEEITIEGTFYQREILKTKISKECEFLTVSLTPDERYRFSPDTMKIYGKLGFGKFVKFGFSMGDKKLIEGCKKGGHSLRIFSENDFSGGEIMLLSGENYQLVRVKKGEKPLEYLSEKALEFDTDAQTQILEALSVCGREDNTYFLPLRKKPEKLYVICGNKLKKFEEISQMTNFDFE